MGSMSLRDYDLLGLVAGAEAEYDLPPLPREEGPVNLAVEVWLQEVSCDHAFGGNEARSADRPPPP